MNHHTSTLSRKKREQRRRKAGRLFTQGLTQAEVARKLSASPSSVNDWHRAWEAGGMKALDSKGPPGFASRLTPEKRQVFKRAILKGPLAFGYPTDLWTLPRLAAVMQKVTGVRFCDVWTWHIVRALGFTPQKPQVRVTKRDERATKAWKEQRLPSLKKWASKHGFLLGFEDESGIAEKPVVRTTWALKGRTPTILSSGSWKNLTMAGLLLFTPKGTDPRILFRLQEGSMDQDDFITFLKDMKQELKGRKLLLIWDGLPAHRSAAVTAHLKREQSWLRVERYPAYAPELSPVEFIWSPMKTKDLAHIPPRGVAHLTRRVRASFRRIQADTDLLMHCLRKAEVFD